jgi:hypothetical protein
MYTTCEGSTQCPRLTHQGDSLARLDYDDVRSIPGAWTGCATLFSPNNCNTATHVEIGRQSCGFLSAGTQSLCRPKTGDELSHQGNQSIVADCCNGKYVNDITKKTNNLVCPAEARSWGKLCGAQTAAYCSTLDENGLPMLVNNEDCQIWASQPENSAAADTLKTRFCSLKENWTRDVCS